MVHVERVEEQLAAMERMEVDNIPHGAIFPIKLIGKHLSGKGLIINAGCGSEISADLQNLNYGFWNLDINPAAVDWLKLQGVEALRGDATRLGFPDHDITVGLVSVEQVDGVLAQGLLCNLVGTQANDFFQVAEIYLKPEGFLFVADILQPAESIDFLKERLSLEKAEELVRKWERRYKINEELGLPYGTFVVAKPGLNKTQEWGDRDQLEALEKSDDFERYARHFTRAEIRVLADAVGLSKVDYEPAIFRSRNNEPLLGCLYVFQKPDCHQYLPDCVGLTRKQKQQKEQAHTLWRWEDQEDKDFWDLWAERLRENFEKAGVNWQEIFSQLQEI